MLNVTGEEFGALSAAIPIISKPARAARTIIETWRPPWRSERRVSHLLWQLFALFGRRVLAKVLGQVVHDGVELFVGSLRAPGGH